MSSKTVPVGVHSRLTPRGHYQLVISAASPGFRLPAVGTLGLTVTSEEVTTSSPTPKILEMRDAALTGVTARLFVLWDKARERGWLVRGDTVALHLLRVYLQKKAKGFDSTTLKHLGDKNSSAYKVLKEFSKVEGSLDQLEDTEGKYKTSDDKQRPKTREEVIKEVIGPILEKIYSLLIQLSKDTLDLNKRGGVSGQVLKWFAERWSTTLRGWDFDDLASGEEPQVYVYKMDKDPGWLRMVRELNATFLFARGLGEILEPRAGSCCPYFPTLPIWKNFLAADMKVLESLITKLGGEDKFMNLPDNTVARLSLSQGWARRLDPFAHPNCRGDHLGTLDPSCFPVQGLQTAQLLQNEHKAVKKDLKLLKDNTRLYTKREIGAMAKENPNGIVVFGRQPGSEELKDMYRQRQQNDQSGTPHKVEAALAAAQSSDRPPSRGSIPGSSRPSPAAEDSTVPTQSGPTTSGAKPTRSSLSTKYSSPSTKPHTQQPQAGATEPSSSRNSLRSNALASDAKGGRIPTETPGKPSAASVRRASSVASIRSIDSSTNRKATGAGSDAERPQASTSLGSPASTQRTPSISSVRSTASKANLRAPSTATGAGQLRTSSPQPLADSTHKTASNASLRSAGSNNHPRAAIAGSGRPGVSTTDTSAPTVTRKSSNSSVRTTGSVDSKATGGSNPQVPAGQLPVPTPTLKKTTTDASDKTTSSRASRSTQGSAAGSTSSSNRQKQQQEQQRLRQLGAATAAAVVTEGHHTTSSGPAPTTGGGQDG